MEGRREQLAEFAERLAASTPGPEEEPAFEWRCNLRHLLSRCLQGNGLQRDLVENLDEEDTRKLCSACVALRDALNAGERDEATLIPFIGVIVQALTGGGR